MRLLFVSLAVIVSSIALSPGEPNPYGGIIGVYEPSTGIDWFRDWNASYNHRPGVGGRPANKLWTVGKIDDRKDGPPASTDTSRANMDAIFAYEQPIIAGLIQNGYTGQYWEIANEPNYYPYFEPADYAYAYRLYCDYIKSLDASARCVTGGLLLGGRWQVWLNEFVALAGSPDVWGIHPYAWWDTNAGQYTINKMIYFRQYLDMYGLDGPIWITEFGYPGPDQRPDEELVAYIDTVCGWLNENAAAYGIERWFWFQYSQNGPNGLFHGQPFGQQTLTPAGQAYLRQMAAYLHSQATSQAMSTVYLPLLMR